MKILLTGAAGFLGWHTRVRMHALTEHEVVSVTRENWPSVGRLTEDVDAVIHIAGVNRGEEAHVEHGNVSLATDLADAIARSGRVKRVVYANSIQAGNGTPYGAGKAAAAVILRSAAMNTGADFVDVSLPNLFGEHGRPGYNSFVATFVDAVVHGHRPTIQDRPVALLHAQSAAQALLEGMTTGESRLDPKGDATSVSQVYALLREYDELYGTAGDIPALNTHFRIDLFNTYRAALFPQRYPMMVTAHSDDRGRLIETVRAHGGQGQTFVSTTRPGVTRGEHFHLGKVERFVVLSGQARIALRRVCDDEVVSFDVSGDSPAVVDMPTMWVHNITNTGDTELTTLFWTHSLFDRDAPDTYWEPVSTAEKVSS